MSRKVYDGGTLVEEWDDKTQTYTGPDGARPYTPTEADMATAAAKQATRAALLQEVDEALGLSQTAVDRIERACDDARVIADADTMTGAQVVAAIKQLARCVAVLAEHDARNRRDIDTLIRMVR